MQLVVVPTGGHMDVLVQHLQGIQKEGFNVMLVSTCQPFKQMRKALDEAGIQDIMILDLLTTSLGAVPTEPPQNAVFLPSPTMLEMAVMRVEQLHRIMDGPVRVVFDCLDQLAHYSHRNAVEEFTRYLVNRLHFIGAAGDLLVTDSEDGRYLLQAATPYIDGELNITS